MAAFDPYSMISKVRTASVVDAIGRKVQHKAWILDLATPTPGKSCLDLP